jgi:predicted small lipoprotein YifL
MIRVGAVLACLLLAACGQKGDLYMPEPAQPVVVPATPASPGASTEPEEQDEQDQQRNAAGN